MSRYVEHLWPRHVKTLGAMKAEAVPVMAYCSRCSTFFKVNLDLLIAAYGANFSLHDRIAPCPHLECPGKAHFMVQTGAGVPFRPFRG